VPTFTVLIPSYNSAKVIAATIESLIAQTFTDWNCVVVDDGSVDQTEQIVRSFTDPRIEFVKNAANLGCAKNFQRSRELATGKYEYWLGHDDVLSKHALQRTYEAFEMDPDVWVVLRPYYSFEGDDPDVAARARDTKPLDPERDRIITAGDDENTIRAICEVVGQVSGLAFRHAPSLEPFNPYVWTTHIEPVFATLKQHKGVFLHDYVVAVRIESSQSRNLPKIYDPSPLWSWVDMFSRVFAGKRWERQRKVGIDNIAAHFEGIIQIRCHSTLWCFLREAWLYLWYRPQNALSIRYWAFAFGSLIIPPRLLRRMADAYQASRTHAMASTIQTINAAKTAS
jgi:glycosyltransferase involved in cell wall biosynthesis